MLRQLQKQLGPVKTRLTLRRGLAALAGGLVIGGWIAVIVGMLVRFGASPTTGVVGMAMAGGIPLVMVALAVLRGASWNDAARAVDRHFHLQDRATTALHLAADGSGDPLEAMQIDDALGRLQNLQLAQAARLRVSWQRAIGGVMLNALAVALLVWTAVSPKILTGRATPRAISRDEIVPRSASPSAEINSDMARSGAKLASQWMSLPENSVSSPSSTIGDDVADRYFDRLAE